MNHQGTKALQTERLALRRFQLEDAEAFYQNVTSDSKVNKFLTWSLHKSVEETRELLTGWVERYENPERYCWAIVLKENDQLIGTIAAPTIKNRTKTAEVTYCIGSAWWGHGIVTEALKEVIRYLFEEIQVNRIEAGYDANNPASGRVLEKVRMQKEGILRKAGKNNQGLFDLVFCAVLKEDFEQNV